eukprot:gnl/MRDRNA2_/MRDRNA2_39767_c1_seq1.p1 gnl/MRDRNA2_/MRDRNA2_39767_c1~~gnl/MRDRNA2_/MRDRNA2_39767_c1_seq1.p1  ORF type:complete len:1084 (-),score=202.65 gnl/MRDRNA2_/MRDRNA2_39767_c1_seq1:59-3310(-)
MPLITELVDILSANGSLVFGILWEYIVGARAELFVFGLAIFVHLTLFGTAFSRRLFPRKKMLEEKCNNIARSQSPAAGVNIADIEPRNLDECEQQLQTAFAAGDFRSVLRSWVKMKRFEATPAVDLAAVVESMQRLNKETSHVLSEIKGFFVRHPSRCQVDEMNLLLEASAKSLDTELVEGLVTMMSELNLEADSQSYESLLGMYFGTRDFSSIGEKVAVMKSTNVPLTSRAKAIILKSALRTNNFDEAKVHFNEISATSNPVPAHLIAQLVELACRLHRLPEVLSCLESLRKPEFSPDTINTMLIAATQQKDAKAAQSLLDRVERLARSGPVPSLNARSYQLMVKAATALNEKQRAQALVKEALDSDVDITADLAGSILAFCSASGQLAPAETLLKYAKPWQTQVIAALIRFFSESNLHSRVCDIYELWRSDRSSSAENMYISPRLDVRTERYVADAALMCGRDSIVSSVLDSSPADVAKHIAMIQSCSARKNLDGAFSIFEALQKKGSELTLSIYNTLLDACVECNNLEQAKKLMKKMIAAGKIDVVSYNTMIKAQVGANCFDDAYRLVRQMVEEGHKPNHITYNELINGYIKKRELGKVWNVITEMQDAGVTPNHVTCSILLKDLGQTSSKSDITRIMDLISKIENPMDEVLLSSVMEACVRVGKPELLNSKLTMLQNKVSVQGAHTFGSLIKAYGKAGDMNGAWKCWREMRSRHIQPGSITIGCMVECIASNGDSEGAYDLLVGLVEEKDCRGEVNAVSFGSVLKAFAREKRMDRVWSVFEDMKRYNIAPLVTTYNLLCDACTTNGQMDRIPALLADMDKRGVAPNLITFSTLLKGHCQRSDMASAFDIMKQIRQSTNLKPDEIMYNTLLDGCGMHGLIDEGRTLFAEMQEQGIKPSNYTLSVLVKLMGNARLLDEAFDLVASTTAKYGFKANTHVHANLVQACVTNGKHSSALQVLEGMAKDKQQPDIRTYASILRACINTGMLEEATRLARAALGLPGHEPYPCRNPDMAPKGARLPDNLVNELVKVLHKHGESKTLANPLVADIQNGAPYIHIKTGGVPKDGKKSVETNHPWRKSS